MVGIECEFQASGSPLMCHFLQGMRRSEQCFEGFSHSFFTLFFHLVSPLPKDIDENNHPDKEDRTPNQREFE